MEKEDELNEQTYDISKLIDSIFDKVDCFPDLCEPMNNLISDRRKVMLLYKIISKNTGIRDNLKDWDK